jgi:Ras-related GTP-binding protein A/B
MEYYLANQRNYVFSNVDVLIYIFDIESRDLASDGDTLSTAIQALSENSPCAAVFCFIHKLDLVQPEHRERLFLERKASIQEKCGDFHIKAFGTSIWDESLYNAFADVFCTLIPNPEVVGAYLQRLAEVTESREILLFDKTTLLVISSYTSDEEKLNLPEHRFGKMTSVIRSLKYSLASVYPR